MDTAEFSKFAGILSAALSALSFRFWKSSNGIPSPPLTYMSSDYHVIRTDIKHSHHHQKFYWKALSRVQGTPQETIIGGCGKVSVYSCPESPMKRGAWRTTLLGVTIVWKDWTTKHTYVGKFLYTYWVFFFSRLKINKLFGEGWILSIASICMVCKIRKIFQQRGDPSF